jgi:hypothetical protein
MISQHIFTTIRDNVTGLENGSAFHIYPKRVPDGVKFNRAVVYNRVTGTPTYTLLSTEVQLTCIARKYSEAEALSYEVIKAFQNKRYGGEGDVASSLVNSVVDLPQDTDSGYYLVAVTVFLKTTKAIGF